MGSDGSLSHEEDLVKVVELQEVIDKQSREHSQMKERLAALSAHVTELEDGPLGRGGGHCRVLGTQAVSGRAGNSQPGFSDSEVHYGVS